MTISHESGCKVYFRFLPGSCCNVIAAGFSTCLAGAAGDWSRSLKANSKVGSFGNSGSFARETQVVFLGDDGLN
jgi:hypothetical protein